MRAVWYDKEDSPKPVLHVGELPDIQPSYGEVRVKLHASGVIHGDTKPPGVWGGGPQLQWTKSVPGQDGSGLIDQVGEGVPTKRIGERVWVYEASGGRQYGTSADFTVVPSIQAVPLPDTASFELGASLGVPAMTAHRALFSDGGIQGRNVFIAGGGGAVGAMALQLAKWAGARVITSVSTQEQMTRALSLGADVAINRHEQDVVTKVLSETDGVGVHRVIELAFDENLPINLQILANDGVLAHYGATQASPPIPVYSLMSKGITLRFILVYAMSSVAHADAVRDVTLILKQGKLQVHVAERFRLEDLERAYALENSGKADGKIVTQIIEP